MPLVRSIDSMPTVAVFPAAFGDSVGKLAPVDPLHAALPVGVNVIYRTPLTRRVCAAGKLAKNSTMEAYRYDVGGVHMVQAQTMRCTQRRCRATFAYNYMYIGGRKQNTKVARRRLKPKAHL